MGDEKANENLRVTMTDIQGYVAAGVERAMRRWLVSTALHAVIVGLLSIGVYTVGGWLWHIR